LHVDNGKRLHTLISILIVVGLLLHLTGVPVFAEDGAADWRPTFDFIMRWINFGILVFLLVRYGKQPLLSFLQGQKDEVAGQILEVESKKQQMQEMIEETQRKVDESAVRFEKIKERIVEQGQQIKQQIIEDARRQSQHMLELEKKKAFNRIGQARANFLSELVDAATKHAQDRLPGELNENDHRKYQDLYLSSVNRMAG